MAAAKGNKYAVGNKGPWANRVWHDTIRRVVTQENSKRLRSAAEQLVSKAEEGDVPALRELGDRLDGKPPQMILGPGEHGEHSLEFIHRVE